MMWEDIWLKFKAFSFFGIWSFDNILKSNIVDFFGLLQIGFWLLDFKQFDIFCNIFVGMLYWPLV